MKEYEFVLAIEGDPNTDDNINALFEAGCDDATFGSIDGAAYGAFTRESESLQEATRSAIQQIQSVDGLRVIRIDVVTASERTTDE